MAAIPRELIESELFGHERGAFTGAASAQSGRFEQASGGTLFLDEIGDMPLEAQTRLLRVLQEGEYTTVGGRTPIKADVRIVAATHRDLRQLIRQGLFREDLFYRLNVVPIRLPPLRERTRGHPGAGAALPARGATRRACRRRRSTSAAMERLRQHRWPGNVRELENLVRRLAALYSQEVIGVDVVEAELADAPAAGAEAGAAAAATSRWRRGRAPLQAIFRRAQGRAAAAGLYDRVLREVERPLIRLRSGRPAATRSGRPPAGPQPQHPAQEDPRTRHPRGARARLMRMPRRQAAPDAWRQRRRMRLTADSAA